MKTLSRIIAFIAVISCFAYSDQALNNKILLDALESPDSLIVYPFFGLKGTESIWLNDSNVIFKSNNYFQDHIILESL